MLLLFRQGLPAKPLGRSKQKVGTGNLHLYPTLSLDLRDFPRGGMRHKKLGLPLRCGGHAVWRQLSRVRLSAILLPESLAGARAIPLRRPAGRLSLALGCKYSLDGIKLQLIHYKCIITWPTCQRQVSAIVACRVTVALTPDADIDMLSKRPYTDTQVHGSLCARTATGGRRLARAGRSLAGKLPEGQGNSYEPRSAPR